MRIKQITIEKYRSFYDPFTLPLDERVTIITGANDVGKSGLLQAIELAFTERAATDLEGNWEHLRDIGKPAGEDNAMVIGADVELTRAGDLQGNHRIATGDKVTFLRRPAERVQSIEVRTTLRGTVHNQLRLTPSIILKPSLEGKFLINDQIDLKKPTRLEQAMLSAAFNLPFDFAKYARMQAGHYATEVNVATANLNRLLDRVLPHPGQIKLHLLGDIGGDRTKMLVNVMDRHDGLTPFGSRGAGVRRIISFLTELITEARDAHHRLVLIDEPENSLHADAQHLLREFLYDLTENGQTQVIYATHSPCMLNPMRGHQVRGLERVRSGKYPTTQLMKAPEEGNFLGVRTCLGLTAGDSLVFGAVTVVVEGVTEIRCLAKMIELVKGHPEFKIEDPKKLLGLTLFVDGGGDSFEYMCELASKHGTRVVLFVDGDKFDRIEKLKGEGKLKTIPVVYASASGELEDLVPPSTYLKAVGELTEAPLGENAEKAFNAWCFNRIRGEVSFTNRVKAWLKAEHKTHLPSKKDCMFKTLEGIDPMLIDVRPLRELLIAIDCSLNNTAYK